MADLLQAVISAKFEGGQAFNAATAAAGKTEAAFKKLVPASDRANQSMINLSRVVQDAPFGFIGIANNIDPLLQSFTALKASTGSTGGALKALGSSLLGGGGLALAVSVVTSALVVFGDRIFGAGKKAKEAKTQVEELSNSIKGVYQEQAKEATEVGSLVALLKSETETRDRKLAAIKELQRIQPEVFNNLKLEGDAVVGLDTAYKNYLDNLRTVIAVKIKQAQLEQKIAEQLKAQGVTLTESEKKIDNFVKGVQDNILNRAKKAGGAEGQSYVDFIAGTEEKRRQDERKLQSDIDSLLKDITGLSKGIEVKELKIKPTKISVDETILPKLEKPLPIEGTINFKNLKFVMLGGDLKNLKEQAENNITKSIQKLVVKPSINLSADFTSLDDLKALQDGFRKVGESISQFVSPAIDEMINNIGSGMNAFQAFGQAIVSIFKQVVAKLIQTAILSAIISAISGGAGNVAKGGLSFIQAFKGAFGGFKAAGGGISGSKSYIVGERGPELFTPGVSGNITPNHRLGGFNGAFGGLQVSGYLTGRGNDLVAVIASAGRSNRRLG